VVIAVSNPAGRPAPATGTQRRLAGYPARSAARSVGQYPGFEPGFDGLPQLGVRGEFVEKREVCNVVEAASDIGVKHELRLESNRIENGCDGVMHGTSGTKAIAVWLEPRFPFWLECQLDQGLVSSGN
jgi:hypothetical protein